MIFDTILFDLDGTLVDSAPLIGEILNGMRAERNATSLPTAFFRDLVSKGAIELVSCSLEVPFDETVPLLQEFRDRYYSMPTPVGSLFAGAIETIESLAAKGTKLAICSNKPTHLCHKVLAETKLLHYFGAIVGGDMMDRPKPHRKPVDHALSLVGSTHATSLFVGDSRVDQEASRSAGIPFVFFVGGYDDGVDSDAAWARISTLPQLLEVLKLNGNFFERISKYETL